jgi:membrane protein YdbS with pleckstrin-like domain
MKSYVVSRLNNNESLIMETRKHWFSLLPAVLQLFAALVVIGLTGTIVSMFGTIPVAPRVVRIFLFVLAFILVYSAFQNYFVFFSTELGFTDKRLIGKVGLFRVRSLLTPLNKINNVSGFSGFFGRLFNYGSVQIYSSSGQFVYDYVVAHDDFIVALMEQIDIHDRELQLGLEAQPQGREGPPERDFRRDQGRSERPVLDFKGEEQDPPRSRFLPKKKIELKAPPAAHGPKKDDAAEEKSGSVSFCPYCKAPYTVTPEMEGRLSQCSSCKKQFVIKTSGQA